MTASIDEADARQSQRYAEVDTKLPQVGLRGDVSKVRSEQDDFLDSIEEMAVERAEAARGILQLTKVGAGRISSGENMGGPEVSFSSLMAGEFSTPEEERFAVRVAQVAAAYGRSTLLRDPGSEPAARDADWYSFSRKRRPSACGLTRSASAKLAWRH